MSRRQREATNRRISGIALTISVAVHSLVLGVRLERPSGEDRDRDSPTLDAMALDAIRVIDIDLLDEIGTAPAQPHAAPTPNQPPGEFSPADVEQAQKDEPESDLPHATATEAVRVVLRPTISDVRLWSWRPPSNRRSLGVESAMLRARLGRSNTAVAAARGTVVGMSDWRRTGSSGSTWGLSPGKVHFGSTTLYVCLNGGADPVDCGFGLLPNRREEYSARLFAFTEIARQSRRVAIEDSWKERGLAILARRRRLGRD